MSTEAKKPYWLDTNYVAAIMNKMQYALELHQNQKLELGFKTFKAFKTITALSPQELEEKIEEINILLSTVSLIDAERLLSTIDLDIKRNYFEEEVKKPD